VQTRVVRCDVQFNFIHIAQLNLCQSDSQRPEPEPPRANTKVTHSKENLPVNRNKLIRGDPSASSRQGREIERRLRQKREKGGEERIGERERQCVCVSMKHRPSCVCACE